MSATKTILAAAAESSPTGILKYVPSQGGNYFVGGAYALFSALTFFYVFRRKDFWALCLPIGCLCSAVGFIVRPSIDPYNVSLGLYIIQSMFVVISPAAFLAFNYLLYGRMILAVDKDFGSSNVDAQSLESQPLTATQRITMMKKAGGPKTEKSRFSFIPPRIVGTVFVWSDVITFVVQIAAGGLQATGALNLVDVGDKMFLTGVSLQGASYIFFTLLLTYATVLIIREGARNNAGYIKSDLIMGLEKPVFALVAGLYLSSIFIIIRSIYRIIEFSQGYGGYLVSHEIYLFVLDAAPLLVAVGIWAVMWPSSLLESIFEKRYSGYGHYPLTKSSS
ncbi:RTA-like protein [Kalmanozyma brasiliensis GHG001]|uniref:RTA1-domain-containing protein n=1 Tax=Kalmanozyma brasiliensis (strain GHG001) TaxID=1365824 RepID=V5EBY6_KALBG|nr:RTA-like protein [Kalmanozyma brasiliensis GHG001]EST07951.1 RTA-like protein [Kalmanozyma brasiliensis GHG001]